MDRFTPPSRAGALVFALALAAAAVLGACASAPSPAVREPLPSFAAAFARGMPAAVGVYGTPAELRSDLDKRRPPPTGAGEGTGPADAAAPARVGAGFFISADGLIVTAAHVVADLEQVIVSLADQRVLLAEIVAVDEDADVALLRVAFRLPAEPPLGSSVGLRAGDWVLAIGEPYAMDRTGVAGIVGGRGRHFAEDADLLYIQTDLLLNPGNSGGPLLDARGNIVGMNLRTVYAGSGSAGLSLSIPIELVRQIVTELAEGGRVARPRLGAVFEDVSPVIAFAAGRAYASGALVSAVERGSLAERIGLRAGDIVVGMNGWPVSDSSDLVRALLGWADPQRIRITVYRQGGYEQLRLDPR